ncbi:MAG TPA: hypothetical protein VN700_14425 [Vicinamibacterales bacterium]|nr:hypothetical protein [Vicinamibacterales bacterium]
MDRLPDPLSTGPRSKAESVEFACDGVVRLAGVTEGPEDAQRPLFIRIQFQVPPVVGKPVAEGNPSNSLPSGLFYRQRGSRAGSYDCALVFCEAVNDLPHEPGGRIVALGSFTSSGHDAGPFSFGESLEHCDVQYVAAESIALCDNQYVSGVERVERGHKSGPLFERQSAGHPSISE